MESRRGLHTASKTITHQPFTSHPPGVAQEVLSSIRTVQAFDAQNRECARYAARIGVPGVWGGSQHWVVSGQEGGLWCGHHMEGCGAHPQCLVGFFVVVPPTGKCLCVLFSPLDRSQRDAHIPVFLCNPGFSH